MAPDPCTCLVHASYMPRSFLRRTRRTFVVFIAHLIPPDMPDLLLTIGTQKRRAVMESSESPEPDTKRRKLRKGTTRSVVVRNEA